MTFSKVGLRFRLTLLFAALFGATTLFVATFSYYLLDKSLLQDFDDALYNYCIDFSESIEIDSNNAFRLPPLKVNETKIFPFTTGESFFIIRFESGEILAVNSKFPAFNPPFNKHRDHIYKGDDSSYETLNFVDHPTALASSYRLITFPLDDNNSKPTLFLQVAVPMTTFETQLAQFKKIIIFGLPAVLLMAIFAGLYISSKALQPVKVMIDQTRKLSAANLNLRLNPPKAEDEIKELALTINQMLDRIEKAFLTQDKFIADASHQLLTPLTILRGEVEVKSKTENTTPDMDLFYNSLLQEIDSLTEIIRSMLLLARIDSGQDILNIDDVFIADVTLELLPKLKKIADKKDIKLNFNIIEKNERQPCRGDEELLKHIFFNLIENAIKYSLPKQIIDVRITWDKTQTIFEVEDQGIGITKEQKDDIFQRFSRADTSSRTKGFGLGLPIAQKIAQLHGTNIEIVEKNTQGSIFRVIFNT